MMTDPISGFSRLNKEEKIEWLTQNYLQQSKDAPKILRQYWNPDVKLQRLHEEFTENTISNFYLPFGIAPNFLINGQWYAVPMVTEESSVVAAASKAAKFWSTRGGFQAEVLNTRKVGQVHFSFNGDVAKLQSFFRRVKPHLIASVADITRNMEKRGGGILDIELRDKTSQLQHYFQLHCNFDTRDSMGANFINSCLERISKTFKEEALNFGDFTAMERELEIIMSILSNYVPECLVRVEVSCPVENMASRDMTGDEFSRKFIRAIEIAKVEPHRAVTHNKGAMNGIDAVVIATGNDFRAVEAGVHAYAAKDGYYTSLTHAEVTKGVFRFWMEVPLALGTVGGLTRLHPLSRVALDILQNPSAEQLMKIVAVTGLAQNFAAVSSLITTGIQKGHMKMHLLNILNQFEASIAEKEQLVDFFKDKTLTYSAVGEELDKIRKA